MTEKEMLSRLEEFIRIQRNNLDNEKRQHYPNQRIIYAYTYALSTLENLLGQFKFGPRI